jgi:GT2 family glycosyltransferase
MFLERNLGFGAGHNVAISRIRGGRGVHIVLNPDVEFSSCVVTALVDYMSMHDDIGAIMPRILYPDGRDQHLCKLLPDPLTLFVRRFIPNRSVRSWFDERYELRGIPLDRVSHVPSLSGCFLMVRTDILHRIGGFDERFFMYLEDVDLVRRVGMYGKTVFFPFVSVSHRYGRGSYRSSRLLWYHVRSTVRYFCKWGWVFDRSRVSANTSVRHLLGNPSVNP